MTTETMTTNSPLYNESLNDRSTVAEGDNVIIYVSYGSTHAITVRRGMTLAMKYGALRHDFLIGKEYGASVEATAGYVHVLRATPELWTRSLSHYTQIIYTHDISTIIMQLDLRPGARVAESGTGSGSLTHSLCRCVAPTGHVYTYDIEPQRVNDVRATLAEHGYGAQLVTVKCRDVCTAGFDVGNLDALVLDVPSPWLALEHAALALRPNARLCTFSPCIEQVQRNVARMRALGFHSIDTMTIVPRMMKVNIESAPKNLLDTVAVDDVTAAARPAVVRTFPLTQPTHTSYLTFATLPPPAQRVQ